MQLNLQSVIKLADITHTTTETPYVNSIYDDFPTYIYF